MMSAFDVLSQGAGTSDTIDEALGVVQTVLEYAGTIAFAISAALLAGRRRMNIVGVVVFAVLVAVGGGTLRDILLGLLPVSWVTDPTLLLVAALAATLTIPLFEVGAISVLENYDLVRLFDSAGLALFVVIGTSIALDSGAGAVSAVVIGVISGIGGGMIRDSLADKVPDVFASGHFYASAAATGSALYILLLETSIRDAFAALIAVIYIFGVRILSIHYGWGMPKFRVDRDDEGHDEPASDAS
jgi:uncharacterized membrane protein YeiH